MTFAFDLDFNKCRRDTTLLFNFLVDLMSVNPRLIIFSTTMSMPEVIT